MGFKFKSQDITVTNNYISHKGLNTEDTGKMASATAERVGKAGAKMDRQERMKAR